MSLYSLDLNDLVVTCDYDDHARCTVVTWGEVLDDYLTKNDAQNIYLSQNNAQNTYLSAQAANTFYLKKVDAMIYLTQAEADLLYAPL